MVASATRKTDDWWVVFYLPSGHVPAPGSANALFTVVQAPNKQGALSAATRQGFNVLSAIGPFASKQKAQTSAGKGPPGTSGRGSRPNSAVTPQLSLPFSGFFSSIGGMIGAGIESGIVAIFKDLWNVIVGPLEIIAGLIIAIVVLAIYFKNDIGGAVGMAAMLA